MSLPPRGIRNNNPGNLRYSPSNRWRGQSGVDDAGFVQFINPSLGIRALAIVIRNSKAETLREFVGHYAPATENNVENYLHIVEEYTATHADETIDVHDFDFVVALIRGIIVAENGYDTKHHEWYLPSFVTASVGDAGGWNS